MCANNKLEAAVAIPESYGTAANIAIHIRTIERCRIKRNGDFNFLHYQRSIILNQPCATAPPHAVFNSGIIPLVEREVPAGRAVAFIVWFPVRRLRYALLYPALLGSSLCPRTS